MGGDHAPEEVVRGAVDWARLHADVEVILVGDEARIRPLHRRRCRRNVELVAGIANRSRMDEHPAAAVRRKRDASINVCMRLVKDGRADAVVTAGHTGAGVASAILNLGRLPGVDRPALAVQMVTDSGPLVLLDIGATTDSTGVNLAQYAHMGSLFAERVLGVQDPTVALLSIGEEGGKGEQRVQEATALLEASHCDSSATSRAGTCRTTRPTSSSATRRWATSTMKFFEGLSSVIFDMLRTEFKRPPWGPIGYLFMRPGIGRIREPLRLREAGWRAAAGRERHRAHHPRPGQAPDDRLCRRGRGRGRSGAASPNASPLPSHDSSSARRASWPWARCSRPSSVSTTATRILERRPAAD